MARDANANANAGNNEDQSNGSAHEIPADLSASGSGSDNEEVVDIDKNEKSDVDGTGTSSQTNSSGAGSACSTPNDAAYENTGNNEGREEDAAINNTREDEDGDDVNERNASQENENRGGTNDYRGVIEEGSNGHPHHYRNVDAPPQMMFDSNNIEMRMYPSQNSSSWPQHPPSQFCSSFVENGPRPQHHQQPFDPSASPFSYDPLNHQQQLPMPINGLPPMQLPPVPTSLPPMSNNPNLDATRQYYEARMREHAMQYANAAAGAAWAAARIACGVPDNQTVGGMPGGFPTMTNHQHSSPSYYTPASASMMGPSPVATNVNQGMTLPLSDGSQQRKRTLWKPHINKEGSGPYNSKVPKKAGSKPSTTTPKSQAVGRAPPKSSLSINNETKLPQKRESRGGNDSISSLGSESRDRLSVGGSCGNNPHKRDVRRNSGSSVGIGNGKLNVGGKNGNQRRRINGDDAVVAATPRNTATVNNGNGNGKHSGYHCYNKQANNQHYLRQKRGLNHGHSSKGSLSSTGSGTNNSNPHHSSGGSGRNKKKNRNNNSGASTGTPTNVHLGGLIGKNGARALHELCSKYRWGMPKYNSVETSSRISSNSTRENTTEGNNNKDGLSSNKNIDTSFVLTVHVNGVELGRGRGGTKASAKQDVSRKALAALVPGVVFDPNGILLDLGSSENVSNNVYSNDKSLPSPGGSGNAGHPKGDRSRPQSPDHSEDSSISTAISEEVASGGGALISGGPLSQMFVLQRLSPLGAGGGRFLSSNTNIYPCASTTSGVSSSASDVDEEDENAYYSSRGASVCSTLLHAMWQIDDRIRGPPSYVFDLCPSPPYAGHILKHKTALASPGGAACSKRKKVESSREVTVRMFQCVASLNLYFPKHLDQHGDDDWVSPLDYLQLKKTLVCESKGESSQSRKRKDSFASQSPLQQLSDCCLDEREGQPPKEEKDKDCIHHKLESIGTGSTKRESKHKASAKLLAALFPGCNSMLEVKAEAETARELYAAKKTESQTKQPKATTSPPERKSPIRKQSSTLSMHSLSLSESKEGSKRIKWSDSNDKPDSEGLHHSTTSIENEVDTVLQSLQEFDEDCRWVEGAGPNVPKDLSFDDVGKIVLRRALLEDTDYVHVLLNKNEPNKTFISTSTDSLETEIKSDQAEDEDSTACEENNTEDSKKRKFQFGEDSIILVLSRAVALHDPPLGCASLTIKHPLNNEGRRTLNLCRLGHEHHLPRERFVECLEAFAKKIHCDLDTSHLTAGELVEVALDEIRSFLSSSPTPYQLEDVVDCVKGKPSSHLQSVKEEDSEEAGDGSDGVREDCDNKIDIGASSLVKGRPSKLGKRSRFA